MRKLMNKKRGSKGFTLAELLVVIAILAILVAVAIPIFTNSMREAQLRVNQSAVRSVKAAGVTEILTNWSDYSSDDGTVGWTATATVDAHGDFAKVEIADADASSSPDYATVDGAAYAATLEDDDEGFADKTPGESGYVVVVRIKAIDLS